MITQQFLYYICDINTLYKRYLRNTVNNGLNGRIWFGHFRDGLFYSIDEMLIDKLG